MSILVFKTGDAEDGVIEAIAIIEDFITIYGAPPSLVTVLSLILKSSVRVLPTSEAEKALVKHTNLVVSVV
jgi:hypothetical protein